MKKALGAVLAIVLVAGLTWAAVRSPDNNAATFGGDDQNADECADQSVATLDLYIEPSRPVYRVGQLIKFKVKVHRSIKVDEDKAGERIGPAKEARVILSMRANDVSLSGGAETDDRGIARINIRVPDHAKAGRADVSATALRDAVDVQCAPHEEGHVKEINLLRIRKA